MAAFMTFLEVGMVCGTLLVIAFLVLLALPQCKLRLVGLEIAKWITCVGCFLLVPSPIDLIPDVVPVVGWADDLGYILGGIAAARSALGDRKKRALLAEAEEAELVARRDAAVAAQESGASWQREADHAA